MDAARFRVAAFAVCFVVHFASSLSAATHATANFVVTAPTQEQAEQVGKCAEYWRHELAMLWLGQGMPNWSRPCPISVKVGQIGAGGSTTFTFENGEVFGWNMKVQGTMERILDSVVPHEVNHTIFASHFRRPLPRWADEGAATIVEHESERLRQTTLLNEVIQTRRRIPLDTLLAIKEYPEDMQQVLTLYAEGYSLADYLIQRRGDAGRAVFLKFLADAHEQGWAQAIRTHYGYQETAKLEKDWHGWVLAGSPRLNIPDGTQLAANGRSTSGALTDAPVVRSQTPDRNEPARSTNGQPADTVVAASPQPLPPIPRRLRNTEAGLTDGGLEAPEPIVTAGLDTGSMGRREAGGSWIEGEPVTNSRSRREEGYRSTSSLPNVPASPANGSARSTGIRIPEVNLEQMYGFPGRR